MFDGETGAAIDTIDYTPPRGDVGSWGDAYGNRVDRFLASVAYLDGEKPSVIFSRGYYTRAVIAAYDFDGANLIAALGVRHATTRAATAPTGRATTPCRSRTSTATPRTRSSTDRRRSTTTATCCTRRASATATRSTSATSSPTAPGLEVFSAHEDMGSSGNRGATMRDARTGEILWDIPAVRDTGRAASGDIDPRYAGAEGLGDRRRRRVELRASGS